MCRFQRDLRLQSGDRTEFKGTLVGTVQDDSVGEEEEESKG